MGMTGDFGRMRMAGEVGVEASQTLFAEYVQLFKNYTPTLVPNGRGGFFMRCFLDADYAFISKNKKR